MRLLRVAELAPRAVIEAKPAWAAHHDATADQPVATPADIEWADVVLFGTPTRFGNVASQLKQFIDQLGGLWAAGKLAGKVYAGFVATGSGGGGESTLLALYNSVHHFGGILVPPGYTDDVVFRTGGNPYGVHFNTHHGAAEATDDLLEAARYLGFRATSTAGTLLAGRAAQAAS